MWITRYRRARDSEDGVAMIIAVILSAVIATLAVTSITVAMHSDSSSARGRHWVQSLHVAESGVEQAMAKIQAASGVFSGTFSGATDEGTYAVTVTRQSRNRYTVESTGAVREGRQLAASRTVRAYLAPPVVFKNALFSDTTVATKNNDVITGDIWGNESVIIEAGTTLHGSANAATGYVSLGNGAVVDGSANSGGYDPSSDNAITLGTNARLGGVAKASVVNPPDPITCGGANPSVYRIRLDNGATIAGNATTWGSVTGPGVVNGSVVQNSCTSAVATTPMPAFSYNASNYDPATLHQFGSATAASPTAVSDFQSWLSSHGNRISGTFYLNQSGAVSQSTRADLTGAVVAGDMTIITNTPIFTNGTTDDTTDAIAALISTYQPPVGSVCDVNQDSSECAVHVKNNFTTSGATACLVYAPYGPVAVKNNALQFGSIYAEGIEIKNNQSLTYDARVERMVGFGPVTLEVQKWVEV